MSNDEDPFVKSPEDEFRRDNELIDDDFLKEIEKEIEAISSGPETDPFQLVLGTEATPVPAQDSGILEMQETFILLARNTLAPLVRYMKALTFGETQQEILELSEMVVTPLLPKVEKVGLSEYADDLTFFRSLLLLAMGERDQIGMDAMREVVMEGFGKLSYRFGLEYRGYRLAVRNLVEFYRGLKNIEGISEMDIRKFFAIGVPSLTWIRRTKSEDIQSLSGISIDIVHEIRTLAFMYRSVATMSGASLAKEPPALPEFHDHFSDKDVDDVDVVDVVLQDLDVKSPRGQA